MAQKTPVSTAPTVFASEIDAFTSNYKLSKRECDIVISLVRNVTNSEEIAKLLGISTHTVNNHLKSIFEKTKTKSKTEILSTFLRYAADQMQSRSLFVRRPRILVLDQEELICDYIAQGLSERGVRAYALTDASRVIDTISTLNIDVVVCDEKLPGGKTAAGGQAGQQAGMLETIREIYRCWPLFVFLTGRPDYTIEECHDRGAAGFVEKPVDLDKLFRLIMGNLVESSAERRDLLQLGDEGAVVLHDTYTVGSADIGCGGAFIPMDQAVQKRHRLGVGTIVDISLAPAQSRQAFRVRGQVVWRRQSGDAVLNAGVGVKFIDVSEKDQMVLHDHLRRSGNRCFIPLGRHA
jgi:DNA-binding NarL/FixJ family response regulator